MNLSGFRFAVFAHYDAYLSNAGAFASAVCDAGAVVDFLVLQSRDMDISEQQITAARTQWPVLAHHVLNRVDIGRLRDPDFIKQYDGLFLGAGGEELLVGFQHLHEAFRPLGGSRPVVVTGFPGIVDAGRTAGMLFRCPSDIVLLPAPAQQCIYRFEMAALGKRARNGMLYGFPSLRAAPGERRRTLSATRRILFIDQSAIPRSVEERECLTTKLAVLLEGLPQAEIWLRERVRNDETSIHETRASIKLSNLVRDWSPRLPALSRVRVKHEPLQELFEQVDCALSISSTGLLEAYVSGLPIASLSPFSRVPEYGNAFFRNSGIQVETEHLLKNGWPTPNAKWVRQNILSPFQRTSSDQLSGNERLVRRLQELLRAPREGMPNSVNHGAFARKVARMKLHVKLQNAIRALRIHQN